MKTNRFFTCITALLFTACATVPITGRKQMNLLNESELMQMSRQQYTAVLNESMVAGDYDSDARMVKKVGEKIAAACEEFLKAEKQYNRVEDFEWEFNLIEEDVVNAWCMPGGKIAFYTGIIPVCKDEAGVAVVMSHEIAHAVARHGNERMSQQMAISLGGIALGVAMNEKQSETRDLFLLSYGVGSTLGALAFSRSQESEADKMGLVFMEYAGYDSNEAVDFWKRMAALGGEKPPAMLSTHPADDKRINDIREYIPVAKSYALNKK